VLRELESIQAREAKFHDGWAGNTDLHRVTVVEAFECPTAMENRFIISLMGDLKGKRVLDIGCGLGESSVYLALRGAKVTAVDVSEGMVSATCALAKAWGVNVEGRVSPAEKLAAESDSYDIVYTANTIHHVHDRPGFMAEIHRVLRRGGKFYSFDPVAYNPAINIYRRIATDVRTPDEEPLRTADLALARSYFPDLQSRFFWLLTLSLFMKYYLLDRVHPNADRYWKRIFRETPQTLSWWTPLKVLDNLITRLPLLKYLAWNVVLWGTKA